MFLTCQPGFETLLARELGELHGLTVLAKGPGWAQIASGPHFTPPAASTIASLAFAHLTLLAPAEIQGDSVNALAGAVTEVLLSSLR